MSLPSPPPQGEPPKKPERPQTGTTPASRLELSSMRSDMQEMKEAMREIGAQHNEAMREMRKEIRTDNNAMLAHLVGAMNAMQGTLLQEISTHACRCPTNPRAPGLGVAERTMSIDQIDSLWHAAPVRGSGGSAPGALAVRGSTPGSAPRQERAPHEFESPEGKVGGAKALCKVCHHHRSTHPTSK